MPPQDEAAEGTAAAAAPPEAGEVRRYPVTQPDNSTRHQVVLVTHPADEDGTVRGVPLCYEDQLAQFRPEQFA